MSHHHIIFPTITSFQLVISNHVDIDTMTYLMHGNCNKYFIVSPNNKVKSCNIILSLRPRGDNLKIFVKNVVVVSIDIYIEMLFAAIGYAISCYLQMLELMMLARSCVYFFTPALQLRLTNQI